MAVVDGPAGRVGLFRAASVRPIGMVRGTSMEGGRATGDINNTEAASAAFSFARRWVLSVPLLAGSSIPWS